MRPGTVRSMDPATHCYHIHAVDSDSLIKLIDWVRANLLHTCSGQSKLNQLSSITPTRKLAQTVLVQLVPVAELDGTGTVPGCKTVGCANDPEEPHQNLTLCHFLFLHLKYISWAFLVNFVSLNIIQLKLWQHFIHMKCNLLRSVHYQIGSRMDQGCLCSTSLSRGLQQEAWLHFAVWVGHAIQESKKLCLAFAGIAHQEVHPWQGLFRKGY